LLISATPDISMDTPVSRSSAPVGKSVNYTYMVTHAGTVDPVDLQVTSALPNGLSFVSASSSGAMS
jgi:uncharacterized repeat protein (TIGR01451 family)